MAKAYNDVSLPVGPFSAAQARKDRARIPTKDSLVPFFLSLSEVQKGEAPVGFVPQQVLTALLEDHEMLKRNGRSCWAFEMDGDNAWAVAFADWVNDSQDAVACRTDELDRLGSRWKADGLFPNLIIFKKKEKLAIRKRGSEDVVFLLERDLQWIFCAFACGVHLNGYYFDAVTGECKIYIAKRSASKRIDPFLYDNIAAGAISDMDTPRDTIIREAEEEASLTASFLETRMQPGGSLYYVRRRPQTGAIYSVQNYNFDVELPNDLSIVPAPNDSEVEAFFAFSPNEVIELLLADQFTPPAALSVLDFLERFHLLGDHTGTGLVNYLRFLRKGRQ